MTTARKRKKVRIVGPLNQRMLEVWGVKLDAFTSPLVPLTSHFLPLNLGLNLNLN